MNEIIYICPWNKELISQLNGKRLVINTNGFANLAEISDFVNHKNELICIRIHFNACLTDLLLQDDWETLPLVLYCNGIGDYKQFLTKHQYFKKMNMQIFFPSAFTYNYSELKILSSLGIQCGILLDQQPINWDLLSDLLNYALYTRIDHGHIDPFKYLVKHYRDNGPTDFNRVYFNDPSTYIHMDESGNMSFTAELLEQGEYIQQPIQNAEQLKATSVFKDIIYKWHDHFINYTPCSRCPAWRICLGKFAYLENYECRTFFSEVLEAIEYHKKIEREYES